MKRKIIIIVLALGCEPEPDTFVVCQVNVAECADGAVVDLCCEYERQSEEDVKIKGDQLYRSAYWCWVETPVETIECTALYCDNAIENLCI